MPIEERCQDYWSQGPPWGYQDESLEVRRALRYKYQDYMIDTFDFSAWSGAKVLDLGCGSGIDSAEFKSYGADVTSVDFSDAALELARQAGLNVVKADACNLPFPDNTFDLVYSFGVLHHIPKMEKAISQIERVLKPRGKFMGMIYNRDSLMYAYSIILRGMSEGFNGTGLEMLSKWSEAREGCPFTMAYTEDEVKEIFGIWFTEVTTDVKYNVIDFPDQRKVKFQMDTPKLGWHIIVKAVK